MPTKKNFTWNGYKVRYDDAGLDESGCWGDCNWGKGILRLHPGQEGKAALDTLLHEGLHALDPDMSEGKVSATARALAELLWKAGYRSSNRD